MKQKVLAKIAYRIDWNTKPYTTIKRRIRSKDKMFAKIICHIRIE
jgi:hypothetical protein